LNRGLAVAVSWECAVRRRSKKNNKPTRAELAVGIAVLAVILLVVGLILLEGKPPLAAQRCPIDGMPAEWRQDRPQGASICNYGHFSVVERQAHNWWAAC
jgi:hypothetical protein